MSNSRSIRRNIALNGRGRTVPYQDLSGIPSGTSSERARLDTIALLIARLIEQETGQRQVISETMGHLLEEPERVGSVCLTLLNLVHQYATNSGKNMDGFKALVDFLISSMESGQWSH